jgi:peptidoglycan/xylan/chitin deacetylase (PgdA/CDA1 family)
MTEIAWPNSVVCPVILTFDVDAELLWKVWLNNEPTLIATFVPGWNAEQYPDLIKRVANEGHEIAHHGFLHEDCSKLSVDEEREMILKGSAAIKRVTGTNPQGFRLIPSSNTSTLLSEAGFLYDSTLMDNDQPYRICLDGKPSDLIELPVCFAFNDTSYFAYTFGLAKPLLTPRVVEQVYKDEFDALYNERKYCMFMLHPQIIGRASRLTMLERTIEYMKTRKGVWFTTAQQVADHCNKILPY